MGPKLYRVTFFFGSDMFRCFTTCNGRLHVVRMELLRKMPHQNLGPDRVLSDSSQQCIDLSPIRNYNFGWGPKLYRVTIFFGSHVFRLATEDYILFGLKSTLCRFQPHEKLLYDFGWGPNFIEFPSSLAQTFYDLHGKITCCSDGTLAQDASPED